MFLFDCWSVVQHTPKTVWGCYRRGLGFIMFFTFHSWRKLWVVLMWFKLYHQFAWIPLMRLWNLLMYWPSASRAKRFNGQGEMELLVSWMGKSQVEDSWMLSREFVECFPSFKLECKLGFDGRGIDRYHNTYYRRIRRLRRLRSFEEWRIEDWTESLFLW